MNQPPPGTPPGAEKPWTPPPRQKAASMVTYKRILRKETRKRYTEHEAQYLNITAMMDMMTIILVFLLKSLSSSSAAIPQSNDLSIPKSILSTESAQEGVAVVISKSQISVDDKPVLSVPADASHGVEAKYKRSGSANDLFIAPLADSLKYWREVDKQKKTLQGMKDTSSQAIVIADQNTPYRLLTEVLFTLGQSEFSRFHIMVLQGKK